MRRLLAFVLALVGGCHTCEPPAVEEPAGPEVTIFVPGIKGSFLETESGERAWLSASDLLSKGDRSLALPVGGADRFGPLHANGVLTRFTVFPLFATADVYLPWLEFGKDELPGFVPLAYDWRKDAREAVHTLAQRIDALAAKHGDKLRVNLIGHSLGGLIALTYVRYGDGDPAKGVTWAGAKFVKRLVLVGAPFGGAPSFLRDIIKGDETGRNVRLLAPEAMASFVSTFELLPITFCDQHLYERVPAARRPTKETLAGARAFREALRDAPDAPKPPADLSVLVVAGIARPTIESVAVNRADDFDSADFDSSQTTSGDGRVPETACYPPKPLECRTVKTLADHTNLLNDVAVQRAILSHIKSLEDP